MKTQNQKRTKGLLTSLSAVLIFVTSSHATVNNIAWYRLGENDPGADNGQIATTTTVDVMGVNNLKRFGSPRYTNDIPNGAITHMASTLAVEFNGSNQFYSNAVATTARNNFGIEAWTEFSSASVAGTYIVAHNGNTSANGWGIVAEVGTHSITYRGLFGGGGGLTFGGRTANSAAHVAIVRDNGTCTLYVNGIASGSTNITPILPSGAFTIGASSTSPQSGFFPGTIDEVRVFTFTAGQFSTNDLQINQRLITTVSVTNITRTTATLNGTAGSFEFPTTVWFEYGTTTTNFGNVTPPQELGAGFISSNFTAAISGLNLGDTYYFRAVASNELGVARGLVLNFTTIGFVEGGVGLSFDGTNGYMSTPSSFILNYRQFVVTAWINTTQTTGQVGLVNKYVAGSSNGWQVAVIDGNLRAWFIGNASNYVWDGGFGLNGGPIADGQWHQVAFTVDDSSGGFLYVDGVFKDFLNWTGVPTSCTTTQELSVGRYPGGNGEFFRGRMDEVAIWEAISQTQEEIQSHMNRGLTGLEIGLDVYFRLNEGSGSFAVDSGAQSGTIFADLHGGATWGPGVMLRPAVLHRRFTGLTAASVTLKATANPGLTNATGWFEWGPTTDYGNITAIVPLGSGGGNTNYSQTLTGLTENVTYHYRAVASNGLGASFDVDDSFVASGTNLITGRDSHSATLLPNGKVLITGGRDVDDQALASAELFDPATGKMSPTTPMSVPRYLHTATLLPNGKVLVAGGEGVFPTTYASAELYDPVTATWSATGSMATNRYYHTATLLRSGKVLVAGGVGGGNFGIVATTELYDPASGTWSTNAPLVNGRYLHTATLLTNGEILVTGGLGTNFNVMAAAERFDPVAGSWSSTGSMTTNRYGHSATLLPSGKVLAVGGASGTTFLNTAELYDPVAGTWAATGPMLNYRFGLTATLLPNGRVLASGNGISVPSLYNPLTGTWTDVPGPDPNSFATATLLQNGNVLVAGGLYGVPWPDVQIYATPTTSSVSSAASMSFTRYDHTATLLPNNLVLVASHTNSEIYNPFSGIWSNTARLNTGRSGHTATILPNGRVLAVGGFDLNVAVLRSAELYNATSGTWTNTGNMATNRIGHTATLLLSGKVLVAGGNGGTFTPPVASAEVYDAATGTWLTTGPMTTNRVGHTATLLPNGKVLVTGGTWVNSSFFTSLASAEMFDPATGLWTAVNPMSTNRSGHKAILLPNGTVLVAGGAPGGISFAHSSAEIFDPATGLWKSIASMTTGRQNPTATTLTAGKILFVGGYSLGYLTNAEIFDPLTSLWTATAPLTLPLGSHTATLLPSGKVLIAGGWTNSAPTALAELYDFGPGFSNSWRSTITGISPTLAQGTGSLAITGALFRGISEASSGSGQSSATDFPLIQVRSLENDFAWFVPSTNWSTNSFRSAPMTGLPPGMARAIPFVHGIPGTSAVFSVLKPLASLTLSNLLQAFDGTAKNVSATTVPPGLPVSFTYNGSASAPTNPGSYAVAGTITDDNYDSTSATNTLIIYVPRNFGVDVSHFQNESGVPQSAWNQMFAEGKRFVFIKATEGLTGPHDPTMAVNVSRATAGGLLAGVYHFAHPENRPTTNGAAQEASNMVLYAGTAIGPGRLRPVLDLEGSAATLSTTALTDWVIAFSDEISFRRGPAAAPIIYCSQSFANNELDSRLANYDLWLRTVGSGADPAFDDPPGQGFGDATGVFNNWSFWQYSATGSSGGISPLDLDVCHDDFKSLASFVISNAFPSPIQLTGVPISSNGSFQLTFSNAPGSTFTLLSSTNVTLPLTNWTVLGQVPQASPGQFQFNDAQASSNQQRFYRVRWP